MSGFILCTFGLLVLANFGLQVYVAVKLNNPFMALRGTRVFLRGWKQADALGIRPIMQVWSGVLVLLIVMLCPVALVGAQFGDDEPEPLSTSNQLQPTSGPSPTVPIIPRNYQITFPPPGQVISWGGNEQFLVEVWGSVYFDPREAEGYFIQLCRNVGISNNQITTGQCNTASATFFESVAGPNLLLGSFQPSPFESGDYYLGIGFQISGEQSRVFTHDVTNMVPIRIVP